MPAMNRPSIDLAITLGAWVVGVAASLIVGAAVVEAAGWDIEAIADVGADVGRTSMQLANGVAASTTVVPLWATALFQIPQWTVMIVAPLMVMGWRGRHLVGPRFGAGADIGLGLVVGVATQLLLVPVIYWILFALVGDQDVGGVARELAARATNPPGVIAFVVLVVVMAPIAEELFYRGLFMGTLERSMPTWGAVLVSALVFAAIHFQLLQFAGLFAFGIVLGVLKAQRGGLAAPMAAHAAFNATTVVTLLVV